MVKNIKEIAMKMDKFLEEKTIGEIVEMTLEKYQMLITKVEFLRTQVVGLSQWYKEKATVIYNEKRQRAEEIFEEQKEKVLAVYQKYKAQVMPIYQKYEDKVMQYYNKYSSMIIEQYKILLKKSAEKYIQLRTKYEELD